MNTENRMENIERMGTENATLADGAPSTPRVAERYEAERDTLISIAKRSFASSYQNSPMYKAVEGLEPSRFGVSRPASHHATAYFRLYHQNEDPINYKMQNRIFLSIWSLFVVWCLSFGAFTAYASVTPGHQRPRTQRHWHDFAQRS